MANRPHKRLHDRKKQKLVQGSDLLPQGEDMPGKLENHGDADKEVREESTLRSIILCILLLTSLILESRIVQGWSCPSRKIKKALPGGGEKKVVVVVEV